MTPGTYALVAAAGAAICGLVAGINRKALPAAVIVYLVVMAALAVPLVLGGE